MSRSPWPWAIAGVLALVAAVAVWAPWRASPPEPPVVAVDINPPPDVTFGNRIMVSPDGRWLAAQARGTGVDGTFLITRRLDSTTWQRLPGTDDGFAPSWSPDSRSLVFATVAGKVRRIEVAGGPPQTLCDSPPNVIPFTAWSKDGVILFSGRDGLRRVAASGGQSSQVTALDPSSSGTGPRCSRAASVSPSTSSRTSAGTSPTCSNP